jgi:hypothetical protein
LINFANQLNRLVQNTTLVWTIITVAGLALIWNILCIEFGAQLGTRATHLLPTLMIATTLIVLRLERQRAAKDASPVAIFIWSVTARDIFWGILLACFGLMTILIMIVGQQQVFWSVLVLGLPLAWATVAHYAMHMKFEEPGEVIGWIIYTSAFVYIGAVTDLRLLGLAMTAVAVGALVHAMRYRYTQWSRMKKKPTQPPPRRRPPPPDKSGGQGAHRPPPPPVTPPHDPKPPQKGGPPDPQTGPVPTPPKPPTRVEADAKVCLPR